MEKNYAKLSDVEANIFWTTLFFIEILFYTCLTVFLQDDYFIFLQILCFNLCFMIVIGPSYFVWIYRLSISPIFLIIAPYARRETLEPYNYIYCSIGCSVPLFMLVISLIICHEDDDSKEYHIL